MKNKIFLAIALLIISQCTAFAWWRDQTTNESPACTAYWYGVEISNETTAYLVGNSGYFAKTTNSGNVWSTSQPGGSSAYIFYAIKQLAANALYVAGNGVSNSNIYLSSNGGSTWAIAHQITRNQISTYMAGDLYDSTHGFFGGIRGLGSVKYNGSYYDLAKGWQETVVVTNETEIYGVACPKVDTFYAVGKYLDANNPGLYRSTGTTDCGKTWTRIVYGGTSSLHGIHALTESNIWVVGNSGTVYHYNGTTWSKKNSGIDLACSLESVSFYDVTHGYICGYDPNKGKGVIYATVDTGESWALEDSSDTTAILYSIKAFNGNNAWAAGGSGGIKDLRILKQGVNPTITTVTFEGGSTNLLQGYSGSVTIEGTNFQTGLSTSSISFGTKITVDSLVRNSSTNILLEISVAPDATIGNRDLTITNPDSGSVTKTNACTIVTHAPIINSFSPTSTNEGTTGDIAITGNYFQDGITFTFSKATVNSTTYNNAQSATVNITANTTGTCTITAINPDLQVGTKEGFYINDPSLPSPNITDVSPGFGVVDTNVNLTVSGTNLPLTLSTTDVFFSPSDGITVNAPVTPESITRLYANITISPSAATGSRILSVRDPASGNVGSIGFIVSPASGTSPTVSELVPWILYVTADATAASALSAAATIATETIMVNGTDFDAAPTVSFTSTTPGKALSVLSCDRLSSTQLRVSLVKPTASLTGAYNVTVMNSTGLTGTLASALSVREESTTHRMAKPPLAYPNPCSSFPVTFQFMFTNNIAEVTFYIVDIKGRVQRTFSISNILAGQNVKYQFDGLNSWGHGLANGLYTIVSKDNQGRYEEKLRFVVLR